MPRVEENQIKPVEWKGWQETTVSSFGIREPLGESILITRIDVVLVLVWPLTETVFRLGYGRGFYDRFLPGLRSNAFNAAFAMNFKWLSQYFLMPMIFPCTGL